MPAAHAGAAPADEGHIGIQLVDAPASAEADPRAHRYIVDHAPPGASLVRHVRVENRSAVTEHVELYPAAATVTDNLFTFAEDRAQNEMTGWVSVDPPAVDVPAGGSAVATVNIHVPAGATSGEQYGVIWAQVAPAADAASPAPVTQVYRAGVRVYLDVGPGGAPPTDFRITSLTASRGADRQPRVVARVQNTGGRTLDLGGSLLLTDGPATQSAGPFSVDIGATVIAGGVADVVVRLDTALPDGPWHAELELSSGLEHRSAAATLTFPAGADSSPVAVAADTGSSSDGRWLPIVAGILALLAAAALAYGLRRHRSRRNQRRPTPARGGTQSEHRERSSEQPAHR